MDPLEAAQALFDAIVADDVLPCLHADIHFRSDVHGVLDADGIQALLDERLQGPRRFVAGDRSMKRNLVFAWWQIEGIDGAEAQGTWVLSFDRDGRVLEWAEFKG